MNFMKAKKIIFYFYSGLVLILLFLAGLFYYQFQHLDLEVYFLDIGQGDSILIKTPRGQTILVDGGPDNTVVYKLGRYLPFYQRSIDLIVATHPDSDHIAGLNEVLKRYEVKYILLTGIEHQSATYQALLDLVVEKNIKVLDPGQVRYISLSANSGLEIIFPFSSLMGQTFADTNDASILARLIYGQFSALLTGDATLRVETEVLAHGLSVQASVLKVGHHGSDTSSGQKFLEAVAPSLAVISAGLNNKFGHPKVVVLDRLHALAIPILLTSQLGDIKIFSDGQVYWY